MAQSWTSSELELALGLPPGPLFGPRLQARLRDAARTGVLDAGATLPSTRELAAQLEVARGTVVSAYEQLVAEGYLVTTPGGRTSVSPAARRPTPARPGAPVPTRLRYDLRPGVPDLAHFPSADWSWALSQAARRIRPADLDYGDGRGHPEALDVLAAHLRRSRAAVAHPDDVIFATGFAQCVALVFEVLAARGVRTLAVEDPGDRSVDIPARREGLRLVPIPVDRDGIDVEQLTDSPADAVLVTPAHQSPTGAVLSPGRRTALVEWASTRGAWIIEDDYDSEFRYDRQPVGALQGLAPDRVILVGSASKTHAPALRLAWLAAPAALVNALAEAKRLADRGGSAIDQLALATLIESGRHERQVRAMRGIYSERRRVLVGALAARLPGARLSGLEAGFHGVLELPTGSSEDAVVSAAADRSLRLVGLSASTLARRDLSPSLVLGFGNIDNESLVEAIALLAGCIRSDRASW